MATILRFFLPSLKVLEEPGPRNKDRVRAVVVVGSGEGVVLESGNENIYVQFLKKVAK